MRRLVKKVVDKSVRSINHWLGGLGYAAKVEAMPGSPLFTPALPVNHAQLPPSLSRYYQVEEMQLPPVSIYTLENFYISWHTTVLKNLQIFLPAMATPGRETLFQDSFLLK